MITESQLLIERVQTGVRMEKRLLKVLKAFAEYHDMSLGDLLEGIVLHCFRRQDPLQLRFPETYSGPEKVLRPRS